MMVEDKKPDFLELASKDSRGRGYLYFPGGSSKTDPGFPRASCTPVEMCVVDSNFPRASFPPGELFAERQDYVRRASLTGSPVCYWTVTGSLLFGSPHRLVQGSSCLTLFLPRWTDELEDIPVCGRWTSVRWQNVHSYLLVTFNYCFFSSDLISNRLVICRFEQCVIYSGTLAIVLFYCLVVARFLLSDVSSAMEQAGPSSASSAHLKERFYAFH